MAGLIDAATGLACSYLSLFCVQTPPADAGDPGRISEDFYRKLEVVKPAQRQPLPGKLVLPDNIDFGTSTVGEAPVIRRISISNSGELPLEIRALEVSGSENFDILGSCPQIEGGGVCVIEGQFSPKDAGPWNGSLMVGIPGDIYKIPMIGRGEMQVVAVVPPKPTPVQKKPAPIIKEKPKPQPAPAPDPRIRASINALNAVIETGPMIYEQASIVITPQPLPPLDQTYHLKDVNYAGEDEKASQKQSVSSFPVERCRIIPTNVRIPIIIDQPINSQICGAVDAHVAVDIYGPDGRIKLIAKGAPVEGVCEPLEDSDTSRIAVKFKKLTLNSGAVINLEDAEGSDAMGQAGLVGEKFERIVDKYGPTVAASTAGAVVAYLTAASPDDSGNAVDSPLSAAGEAINQNIAQVVAEELRIASTRKRRIRVAEGTLAHIKPTNLWYFPNTYQVIQMEPKNAKVNFSCNDDAFKDESGIRQNSRP